MTNTVSALWSIGNCTSPNNLRNFNMRRRLTQLKVFSVWDKASLTLLLVATAVALLTFRDYGLSWDYEPHDTYGRQVFNFYKSLGEDRDAVGTPIAHHTIPMRVFGGGFEVFVNVLRAFLPGDYYEQRHLATFFFSLIGVAGTIFCARCIAGPQAGFFAGLFLLLYPAYYGHSFINHKDLPVAVTYMWVLASITYSIDNRLTHTRRCIILLGCSLGYLLSIRAGMIFTLGYIPLAWLLVILATLRRGPSDIKTIAKLVGVPFTHFMLIVGLSWIVMCALWPYAMVHPLDAPMAAIGKFSSFPWRLPMFFEGNYYLPENAPWHYIGTWLLIQLPEYLFVALALALHAAYVIVRQESGWVLSLSFIKVLILIGAMLVPITGIVWKNATVYDAVRHLLFLSPVLAVLAAVGFVRWFQQKPVAQNFLRLHVVTIFSVLLLLAGSKLASLHPYQYIFANYIFAGGVERASQRFESDYWATCAGEAVSWIFANYPSATGRNTVISGWADQLQIRYPVEKLNRHRPDFIFSPNESDADLYITTGRFRGHVRRDRLVNVITRDGAKLCYIFARTNRQKR